MDHSAVSQRDLKTILRIAARADADDVGEPLPQFVLEGIRELIPCDYVVFCAIDTESWSDETAFGVPLYQQTLQDDVADDDLDAAFRTHYWHCLDCSYPDITGDLELVVRLSDFYSDRALRDIGMWVDYLQPQGLARELKVCLPSRLCHTHRVILWRGPGLDFSERDRALLALLRPHLAAHIRRWRVQKIAHLLTPRQLELLRLAGYGYTNVQISQRLVISEATVRTHLDNIYARLGVTNRVAATWMMSPDNLDDLSAPAPLPALGVPGSRQVATLGRAGPSRAV